MSLSERILTNQKNVEQGRHNYIPNPPEFGILTEEWPGRLKGDLTCLTAGSSVGKSTMARFMVFRTIDWAIKNNVKYKCLYFALEESVLQFQYALLSYLLYKIYKIEYNIEHFEAVGRKVDPKHYKYLVELDPIIEQYMSYVIVVDNINNSYGIYKYIRDYAKTVGKFFNKNHEEVTFDLETNDTAWKYYELNPENEDMFIEILIDHLSELSPQTNEKDVANAMENLTRDLRHSVTKRMNFMVIIIHQQMLELENLEHIKSSMIWPSLQGLGDNKRVGRTYLNIIGICNPARYDFKKIKVSSGTFDLEELGFYQRCFNVIKRRYGKVGLKSISGFLGCAGHFTKIDDPDDYRNFTDYINQI